MQAEAKGDGNTQAVSRVAPARVARIFARAVRSLAEGMVLLRQWRWYAMVRQ